MKRSVLVAGAAGLVFLLGQSDMSMSSENSAKKWAWSWASIHDNSTTSDDGKPVTVGSGLAGKETRRLPPFTRVLVKGSINVAIEVAPGPASADIAADDNLVAKVQTKVEGDVLTIYVDGSYRTHHPLIVTVHAPTIAGIDSEGSSDIQASGVDAKSLKLVTSGSGDIKATGKADAVEFLINGSGNIEGQALDASHGSATVNGTGNIALHVRDKLTATVNGSGNIGSTLHPTTLVSQIHGTGDIDL